MTKDQKTLADGVAGAEKALHESEKKLAALDAAINQTRQQLEAHEELDPEAEEARRETLAMQQRTAAERKQEFHTRVSANRITREQIRTRQAQLETVESKWRWVKVLSDTAGGNLAGKEKIMLETYVQMAYFDRIIARANVRFLVMSGGQYELKRRRGAENNRSQSGLELDVVDHYNGSERSVKTLSGGESFKASLSLALGLSDRSRPVQAAFVWIPCLWTKGSDRWTRNRCSRRWNHWRDWRTATGWWGSFLMCRSLRRGSKNRFRCTKTAQAEAGLRCAESRSVRGYFQNIPSFLLGVV